MLVLGVHLGNVRSELHERCDDGFDDHDAAAVLVPVTTRPRRPPAIDPTSRAATRSPCLVSPHATPQGTR
jgi:hypothetical protein